MNFRMPKAFTERPAAKLTAKQITAGGIEETTLDMSDDVAGNGLCPDCKRPMEKVVVDEEVCWACLPCRVSLPMRDPEHAVDPGEPVQPQQAPSEPAPPPAAETPSEPVNEDPNKRQ